MIIKGRRWWLWIWIYRRLLICVPEGISAVIYLLRRRAVMCYTASRIGYAVIIIDRYVFKYAPLVSDQRFNSKM